MNEDLPVTGANLTSAERTRTYRAQIENERQQRITEHQQAIARHQRMLAATPGAIQPLNLFADGDSWFDYPLPFPQHTDVIARLRNLGTPPPFILNLAHHGDEARDKLGVQQRLRIEQNLKNPANGVFDAILFSGGGNDTVGDQFCLWLNDAPGLTPVQAINLPRLNEVLGVVRSAYEDLITVRDKVLPQHPIFIHAYDFAVPDGRRACSIGPWLKPSLEYRHWMNLSANTGIVREFLLHFDNLLQQIESTHLNVIYIRTQGTLMPVPGDWDNELHPTPSGFDKIAAKFRIALQARFPGRI